MSLLGFQTALARHILPPGTGDDLEPAELSAAEIGRLEALFDSPGLRVTAGIQRSWCEGRAFKAAPFTLSALSPARREDLVAAWVKAGGGAHSFPASEADAFLDFIVGFLTDPSHELTVCRIEQALARATAGALGFNPPDLAALEEAHTVLRASHAAALVRFSAEPELLLQALAGKQPVRKGADELEVLFAPGLPGLCRPADPAEVRLWRALASPRFSRDLLREGHGSDTIERMVLCGGVDAP